MSLPKNCPLCSSSEEKLYVISDKVYGDSSNKKSFYGCEYCKIIFQFPFLSKIEEKEFYKYEFEKFMDERAGTSSWTKTKDHIKSNEVTYNRRIKFLKPHLYNNMDILEIGCSSGFMLYKLKELNCNVHGIEPSNVFKKHLLSKNIALFDSLDEIKIKFDLIIHFFVMEHIVDVEKWLKKQYSLLNKNGKIIIEVPSSNDPLRKIYNIRDFHDFYWSKVHPWYFNPDSIIFLMNKLGWKYNLVNHQRYDLSNHIYWAKSGKPGGMGMFTNILGKKFENQYKNRLEKIGLTDTIILTIYK